MFHKRRPSCLYRSLYSHSALRKSRRAFSVTMIKTMAMLAKGWKKVVGGNKFLVGKWNELGSVMTIDRPFNDMSSKGTNETQVGEKEKKNVFLVGTWKNELGSVMTIQPSDCMSFEGRYKTQVGAEEKGPVPLYGVMNPIKTANPTFTFCVAWNVDKDSCSAFVGQYFKTPEGEKLLTMWLLREAMDTDDDNWEATLVGKNIFKKEQNK